MLIYNDLQKYHLYSPEECYPVTHALEAQISLLSTI